jgi:hypothetical protein
MEPIFGFPIYMPIYGEEAMTKTSEELRQDAAKEIRKSLNGGSATEKADNRKRAAAYESLAENEEWLAGEGTDQQRPEA